MHGSGTALVPGKTSVIAERTAYLTTEGAGFLLHNILVVTFSRACGEGDEGTISWNFTGQECTPVTFGTFHGVYLWNSEAGVWIYMQANILSEEEKSAILQELALNHGGRTGHEEG